MFKRLFLFIVTALVALSASAQNQATISYTRPTTYANGTALDAATAVTYNLYQGIKGQAKSKVATVGAVTTTVNVGLQSGVSYCWTVSVVANGIEGDQSLEGCKDFSFGKPSTVTIIVQ